MPLASGGMARIFLAKTGGIAGFERYIVLKMILADRMHDATAVNMFLDEARLAASLNHHNVAQVIEVGNEGGVYYLAMEYVHGQDLRAILASAGSKGKRVPLDVALAAVAGAAAGLEHAHDRRGSDGRPLNIVHRDVSPSNVMVGYDGSVKVLDFGIAKAAERTVETQSGMIKGKFAYMSPEQCRGRDVDRRSDVFALGILLYEATTQHRCFRAESDYDTMTRVVTGDVVRPTRVVAGYPPALEAIVMKALATDAAQRYQTARLMLEAIEGFASSAGLALTGVPVSRFMLELFGTVVEPWLQKMPSVTGELVLNRQESTNSNVDRAPASFDGQGGMRRNAAGNVAPAVKQVASISPMVSAATLVDDVLSPSTDDGEAAWERMKSYPSERLPTVPPDFASMTGGADPHRATTARLEVTPLPAVLPSARPAATAAARAAAAAAAVDDAAPTPLVTSRTRAMVELAAATRERAASAAESAAITQALPPAANVAPPLPALPALPAMTITAPTRGRRGLMIGLAVGGVAVVTIAAVVIGRFGPSDGGGTRPAHGGSAVAAGVVVVTPDARRAVDARPDAAPAVAALVADAAPVSFDAAPGNVAPSIKIVIRSTPSGADVYEGTRRVGRTPYMATREAGRGRVTYSVRESGYVDGSTTFDLTRGGDDTVRLRKREVKAPVECRKLGAPKKPGSTLPTCPS